MDDCVAGADDSAVAATRLPRDADARFEGVFIVIDSNPFSGVGTERGVARDQELAVGWVEVRLPIRDFRDWRSQIPGEPEIDREIRSYPPIVLNEGAESLPTAARGAAIERLVMNGEAGQAEN